MKLEQLNELNSKEVENIEPGSLVAALLTSMPLLISAINPLVGLVKTSFSEKGEIKTKDTNYKWENSPKKGTINEKYYLNF